MTTDKIEQATVFKFKGVAYDTEAEAAYAKDVNDVVELIKNLIQQTLDGQAASTGQKGTVATVEGYLADASIQQLVSLVLLHKKAFVELLETK